MVICGRTMALDWVKIENLVGLTYLHCNLYFCSKPLLSCFSPYLHPDFYGWSRALLLPPI